MRPVILLGIAIAVSIVIAVTINFFVLSPRPLPADPEPSTGDSEYYKGLPPECDVLQAKVDAAGRPGWDGLGELLQAEIKASPGCYIIGDEESF